MTLMKGGGGDIEYLKNGKGQKKERTKTMVLWLKAVKSNYVICRTHRSF